LHYYQAQCPFINSINCGLDVLQNLRYYGVSKGKQAEIKRLKGNKTMFNNKFGIEMTGITRNEAARVDAEFLGATVTRQSLSVSVMGL